MCWSWPCIGLLCLPGEASWQAGALKVTGLQRGMVRRGDLDLWRHSFNKAWPSFIHMATAWAETPRQSRVPDQGLEQQRGKSRGEGWRDQQGQKISPCEASLLPCLCYVGFQPKPQGNCTEMGGLVVDWRSPKMEDSRILMCKEWWWSPNHLKREPLSSSVSGRNTPTLSPLVPLSRTAAAGTVKQAALTWGDFPPHPLFHLKVLNLPNPELLSSLLSALRRGTASGMADSFTQGRLTEPSEIWSAFFPWSCLPTRLLPQPHLLTLCPL